ncbi:MAG TPA: O-antigen ligase domain-containing protein, partial [Dermatophilaceae bacterium]|nr:O-antigen ligase domain-containing protein [Dermatophilaceae bacterium]
MTTVWRVGQWTLRASGVVVAVGLIAIAGLLVPSQPLVSAGIALGALALGLTLLDPIALPTLAIPALLVVSRVGAGGTNLAMSDFVLAAAFIPAVLLCQRPVSREFASVIGLNAVYQFATLLTVVANPYLANVVEWFHAWMLVSGALFVGWAIGRGGR